MRWQIYCKSECNNEGLTELRLKMNLYNRNGKWIFIIEMVKKTWAAETEFSQETENFHPCYCVDNPAEACGIKPKVPDKAIVLNVVPMSRLNAS